MSVSRKQLDYYQNMQVLLRIRNDNEFYKELENSEQKGEPLLGLASNLDAISKITLIIAASLTIYMELI